VPSNPAPIFVIERDEALRDSIGALLESIGLRVRGYGSYDEFARAERPSERGCLLIDLDALDNDALRVLDRLRADGRRRPAILITQSARETAKRRAADIDAVFLQKPFEARKLIELVLAAFD